MTPPALLLVDLQQDFLQRSGMEPHPGALVEAAARWLESHRRRGLPIAHLHTRVFREPDQRMPHWKDRALWAAEAGTPGALPPPELSPLPHEPVFEKSGFLPRDPSPLAAWAGAQPGGVVLAGAMTHACVQFTAAVLASHGVRVHLAEGACGSDRPHLAAAALAWMESRGILRLSPDAPTAPARFTAPAPTAPRAATAPDIHRALQQWADLLDARQEDIALTLTAEIRKPASLARQEAGWAARLIRQVLTHHASALLQRTSPAGTVRRTPLGRIAILTPWNNPCGIPAGRIAAALAYGNTAVWKPSPRTPRTARLLLDLARQAGIPEGCLDPAEGGPREALRLIEDPATRAVVFTGSLENGREVLAAAAARMLPCQLELGGNNPAVVLDDADVRLAAREIAAGAFTFAGQRCTATRRAIATSGILPRFRDALQAEMARWRPRPPEDPECLLGPVIDTAAAARIDSLLKRAVLGGAHVTRCHTADARALGPGGTAPALVENALPDSEIIQEESFGPVLVIQEAKDKEEAFVLANGTRQGLAASLFSSSSGHWEQFQAAVEAAILKWNQSTAGPLDGAPFGGWKHSGWGGAEQAEADVLFFTRLQTLTHPPL